MNSMHKYLPSKKFILIFSAIILSSIIIWFGGKIVEKKHTPSNIIVNQKGKLVVPKELADKDSDGDGLKDWEESLWKTNPKDADTDSDGTNDYDEIKINRNPLKPNHSKTSLPDDKISEEVIANQKKAEEEFNQLTDTQKISRVLFSQYIAAKQTGKISDSDKQIILDTAINMMDENSKNSHTQNDFKITQDNSTTTVRNYGNELGKAFFTGSRQENVQNELYILDRAVKTQDPETLKALDAIIEGYTNSITKLELITVPSTAILIHTNLVNDLINIRDSYIRIKDLFSDPFSAIGGMRLYQTASTNLVGDITNIKNYFYGQGIIYKQNEYGFYITNVI